jgi:glutathione S-transferase
MRSGGPPFCHLQAILVDPKSAPAHHLIAMRSRARSNDRIRQPTYGNTDMLRIWGRDTSSNVQKAMFAIGELKLAYERIDVGGQFGKNREPDYLAMNPNGLVPTLEEDDGFLLWESNSIIRYLAAKHGAGALEPSDAHARALASKWMDWQLSVFGPAMTPVFWGLVRTPAEQRDHKAISDGKVKATAAVKILDEQFARTAYAAGDAFSMGDIPIAIMSYRYRQLVPERPSFANFERWYASIASRQAFRDHVSSVPLT